MQTCQEEPPRVPLPEAEVILALVRPQRQGSPQLQGGPLVCVERTSVRIPGVITVFEILLVISSLLMILLVLLHKGRGGGLSDMFGGGVSSGLGGSSVAERNLDRITVGIGLIWTACVIGLGLLFKTSN